MFPLDGPSPDLLSVAASFSFLRLTAVPAQFRRFEPRLSSLWSRAALLAFTSYTRTEAGADMERFSQHCQQDVEILVNCEENKMRSHRPIRDWEMDEENDVFYSNQFLSVVRCQN